MTSDDATDQHLLAAFSATVTALENLVTLSERLCVRVREHIPADDAEVEHLAQQLRAARERLPKLTAYLNALGATIKVH